MDAFATYQDLERKLKRTFTVPEESEWITELLEDASTYLRGVIGQDIYPVTTSTFTAYPSGGRVDLPQSPVVSVDTVVDEDGAAVDYMFRPGYIKVESDDPHDVTFTWGYATAPDELRRLTCVLVSQVLLPLENGLGLTAGGLSSVALDDFKLAWADAGAQSGMTLTSHAEAAVIRQFGRGETTSVEYGR